MLSSMVKDNTDILMVLETKLDPSFPQTQFRIEGHAPASRYDRNSHGGGILLFIKEDLQDNQYNTFLSQYYLKSSEYSRKNIGYANYNIRQFPCCR